MKHKHLFFLIAILAFVGMAWAQSGPAGVVGNISAWYAVEDLLAQPDLSAVSTWSDRSGNGNDAVQPTSSNQPTLVKGVYNLHPVVRFDGVNDYLSTNLAAPLTQPVTIFFFMRIPPNDGAVHNFIDSPGTSTRLQFNKQLVNNNYRLYAGTTNDFEAVGYDENYVYITLQYNGNSSFVRFNGNVVANNVPAGSNSLGSFYLGARQDLAQDYFLNSDILEFAVYDQALNLTQIEAVENYLDTKYSSTLPIELSSFTAVPNAQYFVELHWTTQSETNVAGFRVYRSENMSLKDAVMFNTFIPATNTSVTQHYMFVDEEIYADGTYYYWLENVDMNGTSQFHGPVIATVIHGEPGAPAIVPTVSGIEKVYPNPFNPSTRIGYMLDKDASVSIKVYNIRGQLMSSLFDGSKEAGFHSVVWNGTTDSGTELPSGIYTVTFKIGSDIHSRRVVLSK